MENFRIVKKIKGTLGRAGTLVTAHGVIETPAFVTVGTQAAVKALTMEQVRAVGAQVVLGNTYHLYLEPSPELVKKAGGLGKFMGWEGPTMTDSGGFQVFSLGAGLGSKVGKVDRTNQSGTIRTKGSMVKIDEDGVTFRSHLDGSSHRFTPEHSIQIQHRLGADIIFAFDECTSPEASKNYQKEALERTHRWAKRSLEEHKKSEQSIFGIVQGGRHEDLRQRSARALARMDFDGFGIGGSFDKKDIKTAVGWVNKILPEKKPRHLLGIGEPEDLFGAIEKGCDLFDCVAPTRLGRHGMIYTARGKINIFKEKFRQSFLPIEKGCGCCVCSNLTPNPLSQGEREEKYPPLWGGSGRGFYSRAYIAHLFRAHESLAGTLASIHNLYFIVNLVKNIRQSILDDKFSKFKNAFLHKYRS
ncbi:hypothetical protein A3I25_01835 [Candidatus Nomurabacteria bacterium RIFCSPLOWO2_02_FULL_42_17]|uniref:Queuine tRNA-ribosyltransferase n=1 Tax=Candidatus Nomurabacteria bacterium RIFCSPLOWO2_02_FULL_42_17 TaxID=1801789 RepID=A0A1F6XQK3_9BACT|nr:MAG: hypothetical protein A3I25_01835 [Candidatus Nomurabacteria bacterium RIFCSPLOWO2_02_FULL_42_17]